MSRLARSPGIVILLPVDSAKQSPWVLAAYFLMILFIFDTIYSLTIIAYNSFFPEVAPTPRDRIDLSVVREILATVALLASFILAPILAEQVGYITMGAIMGTLIAAGYLTAMIGVKEKPIDESKEESLGLGRRSESCWRTNPSAGSSARTSPRNTSGCCLPPCCPSGASTRSAFRAKWNVFGMNLGPGDAEAMLLGVPILLTIPFVMIWRPIVHKLGYRKTWIIGSFAFIPGLLAVTFATDFYTACSAPCWSSPGLPTR
jgi:glycoside/pentoside/hexuronide:cation symporter, GPH family